MRPELRKEVEKAVDEYINSTIERLATCGKSQQHFMLRNQELGRERMQAKVACEIEDIFRSRGIDATYDGSYFSVVVDLDHAVLNRSQANFLRTAKGCFYEGVD